MNEQVPRKVRVQGWLAAKTIHAWMRTLRYRAVFADHSTDPRFPSDKPRIYVFWHEYILLPLYLRPHCNLSMLLSRHKDGDILAQIAGNTGFGCVRGSTSRGGTAALLEMTRRGKSSHLTITPDGPRGPRRQLAIGPIYLASRLGLPIVPLGFGMDRPWRLGSWDRFAIPRPFSRARAVVGSEIHIAGDLDREALEQRRREVEFQLTQLTVQAEAWAADGQARTGEVRERQRTATSQQPVTPRKPAAAEPMQPRKSA